MPNMKKKGTRIIYAQNNISTTQVQKLLNERNIRYKNKKKGVHRLFSHNEI